MALHVRRRLWLSYEEAKDIVQEANLRAANALSKKVPPQEASP
jgi:hypothetical protein